MRIRWRSNHDVERGKRTRALAVTWRGGRAIVHGRIVMAVAAAVVSSAIASLVAVVRSPTRAAEGAAPSASTVFISAAELSAPAPSARADAGPPHDPKPASSVKR